VLTGRGVWFVSLAALLAVAGVVVLGRVAPAAPLLGLTLCVWAAAEWVLFTRRVKSVARLRVDRQLVQGGRPVPAVWAGVPFTVRVTVTPTGPARIPFALFADPRPADLPPGPAFTRAAAVVPGEPLVFEYDLTEAGPGVVRFEGVEVRVADLAGLFYRRLFLRDPVEYLAMPPVRIGRGTARGVKRMNALPPPGVHRLKRPGGGDELLDLRDYRPGDEPKMIAWKASARRDALITKVIESDVPVRCILFVDTSEAVRAGVPGETVGNRLAAHAAAVARTAADNRDLVGLTLFHDAGFDATPPARTRRHQLDLITTLTRSASAPPALPAGADALAGPAEALARAVYPDLFARDLNSTPVGLYWRPISDSRWMWLVGLLLALPAGLLLADRPGTLEAVAGAARAVVNPGWTWLALLVLALVPSTLAGLVWLVHGARGFAPARVRRVRGRKQLGAVFATLDGAGPALVERVIHDDRELAARCRAFLVRHRVRLPAAGPDRAAGPSDKFTHLAAGVARAVAAARDNELYVVFADVLGTTADTGPLEDAVRVARARRHQVLVAVPWPADLPDGTDAGGPVTLDKVLRHAAAGQTLALWADARRKLTAAGATVVRLGAADPVELVTQRLDRLRGAGARR